MELKNNFDTKEKIIYSAIQLLSEGGYEAFTAKNLIEKAGVSKGALYHYFKSLDEIPLEAIKRLKKSKVYIPSIKVEEYKNIRDYLNDYFEYTVESASTRPDVLAISLYYSQKSISNDEFRNHKNELTGDLFTFYSSVIKHFYKKEIPNEIMESIVSMILFVMEGIIAHSFMFSEKYKFKNTWSMLVRTIENELINYQ